MFGRGQRRQRARDAHRELRELLGLALGAARNARTRAEITHAQREFELWIRRQTLAKAERDPELAEKLKQPGLAEVWDRVLRERAEFYAPWVEKAGPQRLGVLVARHAKGPASRPPSEWLGVVGTADGSAPVPALWRVASAVVDHSPTGPTGSGQEFPLAVPLLDAAHLRLTSAADTRAAIDALVESLLLRILSTFSPGLVRVHVWDVGQLTASLPNLYPLTTAGLLTVYDPTRPEDLLAELAGHVRRVHANTMRTGHASLAAASAEAGRRIEPWQVAVLFGNGERLPDEQQRELQRVARNGLDAGVHLILVDVPISVNSAMETITLLDADTARSSMTGKDVTVRLDAPIEASQASRAAAVIADALNRRRGRPRTFADLLPATLGAESSAVELRAPVGFAHGEPVELTIGDATPHALVAGPSGSGKTNFLYALLGSLAARYSPRELELYLLDFKEGVSFAGLAPGVKDPSWLPQARLVGINVNADREFGLALLRFLAEELARRAAAAKRHEVTKLAELREADPDGHWPRIVAVIDEFQALFSGRDRMTAQAAALLEDVARRGRSQGIHLVLASQDIAGIEAFWGKPAVFEQCTLRIAMPKAKRVLSETNAAAINLPRWHAVVNHDSGVTHGNQRAHIPDASAKGTFDEVQRRLWQEMPHSAPPPRLFDGAHVPDLMTSADFLAARAGSSSRPLLGQIIDVADRAAGVELDAVPGRNIAVIGTAAADALSVMDSAILSLARQHEPGSCEFSVWCGVPAFARHVRRVVTNLDAAGHRVESADDELIVERCEKLAGAEGDVPHYVFWYAVDGAHQRLEQKERPTARSGLDHVRAMLKYGPAKRVHTIGWWRGVARLKDTLGFGSGDEIGAWVALDVQGSELTSLAAGQVVDWSPRPMRAVFFDKSTHAHPDVIIPFDSSRAWMEQDEQP